MTKYIDAEKLKAEIERRKVEWKALFDGGENTAAKECFYEDENILDIIDSLKQEHPAKRGYKDCNGCEYNRLLKDQIGWQFRGCFGGDYKGKPIAEIELCPLKLAVQQEQPTKGYDEAYLNKCIAKASNTWEGVDADKYLDDVRGREQKEPHCTNRNALFDKCVENCDPEIMKKVSDEVDEKLKEQKPAEWSKEDEYYMDAIITIINRETALYPKGGGTESFNNDLIDWLKSRRPSWKPSEVCYGAKGDPDPAGVWKPSEKQPQVADARKMEQPEGDLEYWLEYFGMPKENIENCADQIAQGYGAIRYLEGVQDGAEAVNELGLKARKEE